MSAINATEFLDSKYHLHIIGFGNMNEVEKVEKRVNELSKKCQCKISYDGLLHGEEYISYIRAALGVSRGEAERILKETGSQCFDSGIRKVEDIAAIEKMVQEEFKQWEHDNEAKLKALSVNETQEAIEKAKLEAREYAIAMKKFSDRTPNLSKLGDKKVESHRKRFESEMKTEFYKRLLSQGNTAQEAEVKSQKMAEEASNTIISGIIRFNDAKSDIFEA
jgi:hypothetical protein